VTSARRSPKAPLGRRTFCRIDDAAVLIFEDRDLQPFGKDVGAHAAENAADIEPMRHAAGERDQFALVKDRQGQRDVVKVAAGEIGIVGDVDVAGTDVVGAEMLDLGLHRLGHAADEHRQADADGDGLAPWREQAGGEVERLVDDDVVGGAHEVGFHFLGHRNDAVAHDLRDDGIDFALVALLALISLPAFGARFGRGGFGLLCHGCHRPPATLITRFP
jgi:hypothetical protein